jgi:hypothetical protein
MEPLGNWLQREWAARGFCYDLFRQLEATCLARMRDGQAIDDLTILKLCALSKLCQSIQAWLEDNPTTDYHRRMESALLPTLTAAIADLDAGGTDAGPFRRLIAEVFAAPR